MASTERPDLPGPAQEVWAWSGGSIPIAGMRWSLRCFRAASAAFPPPALAPSRCWPPPSCLLGGGAGSYGQARARALVRACAPVHTSHSGTHRATHRVTWAQAPHTKLPMYIQSTYTVTHPETRRVTHMQSRTHPSGDPCCCPQPGSAREPPNLPTLSITFSPESGEKPTDLFPVPPWQVTPGYHPAKGPLSQILPPHTHRPPQPWRDTCPSLQPSLHPHPPMWLLPHTPHPCCEVEGPSLRGQW